MQLVLDSFRDQFYAKALDCVKTLRKDAIKVIIIYRQIKPSFKWSSIQLFQLTLSDSSLNLKDKTER